MLESFSKNLKGAIKNVKASLNNKHPWKGIINDVTRRQKQIQSQENVP